MIKKHEISETLGTARQETSTKVFSEAYGMISDFLYILQGIESYRDGASDEVDVLGTMADCQDAQHQCIEAYACKCNSTDQAIQRLLYKDFVSVNMIHFNSDTPSDTDGVQSMEDSLVAKLYKNIDVIVDNGCFDEEELNTIEKQVCELLGNLAFFLQYEFCILESFRSREALVKQGVTNYADNEDFVLDACVYDAVNSGNAGLDLDTVINTVMEVAENFRASLELFEEYPELENPFIEAMGSYYADVDEDNLTIDIVRGVLDGSISPDKVFLLTRYGTADEGK